MKLTSFRAALTGAALVACGLLAVPTAASAAPPTPPPGIDQRAVPAAEAAAASSYWTAERMRAAIPADVLLAGKTASTPASKVAAGAPTTYGASATAMVAAEAPVSNIGKVFFTLSGKNYVCSGNSVSAANASLVATAAHCVHGGKGKYATNWVFVPAYENGSAPYGRWTATTLTAPTQWTRGGDITYDVAFAKVAPLNGRTLSATVGATPIAFNQARGLAYDAFGYPAAAPFDGQTLQSCAGTASPDPYGQTQSQGIPCDMTGGSSGGPWFLSSGAQNSVNSFGYNNIPDVMFGPYYGSVAQSTYATAAAG
ncbi:trypsin-like serine peptidase [Agromyces indicus]|uniref:Trypsin-like peptidase domain-containing protein n=1 Tax=Agromyces indicus TaxID=758919 RepID=A0ABU1FMC7_9MICO|nr:trypsin-like peptidase domain-containing protein [Agromyces indicus]MDR5692922.1 trypsin-like peptidase domain-containing protein [Agromyces indicus]